MQAQVDEWEAGEEHVAEMGAAFEAEEATRDGGAGRASKRRSVSRRALTLPAGPCRLIRDYLAFTNESLRAAVREYFERGKTATERRHGKIGTWDVGRVTDMSKLFANRPYFNRDLSAWNVSSAVTSRRAYVLDQYRTGHHSPMIRAMNGDSRRVIQSFEGLLDGRARPFFDTFAAASSMGIRNIPRFRAGSLVRVGDTTLLMRRAGEPRACTTTPGVPWAPPRI